LITFKLPWLSTPEGPSHQRILWEVLSTSPLFKAEDATDASIARWTYVPIIPSEPDPSPLLAALLALRAAFSGIKAPDKLFQHTLQTLASFTGYLTTQIYPLPSVTFGVPNTVNGYPSPQEEEVKREIRALKGLVLNRRSFMSRATSVPSLKAAALAGA